MRKLLFQFNLFLVLLFLYQELKDLIFWKYILFLSVEWEFLPRRMPR